MIEGHKLLADLFIIIGKFVQAHETVEGERGNLENPVKTACAIAC